VGGLLARPEGAICWISPSLQQWWDLDPEAWLGRSLEDLGARADLDCWLGPLLEVGPGLGAGPVYGGVAGRWFRAVRSPSGPGAMDGELLGVVDLTLEKRRLGKLERAARRDDLTGLPNRRCFMERLEAVISASRRHGFPVSLAFLDLDDFKQVNDRLGHVSGDAVLRAVGELLAENVRREDLPARLGGEEMVVLFTHMAPGDALRNAERLRRRIEREGLPGPGGPGSPVTVSIGVAGGAPARKDPSGQGPAQQLMEAADRALYAAKGAGKNRVQLARLPAEEREAAD
ncbi:MAG TPA: diguanylate cyclase, partial [Gammaproteobacteria bacterium]|nr:diguanylate cyclase [Gammaproteobacteria bacterium]